MSKNINNEDTKKSPSGKRSSALANLGVQSPPFRACPDSSGGQEGRFAVADSSDYVEILEIQKKAFQSEAVLYQNFNIQPLTQTLDGMKEECKEKIVLKMIVVGKIVGSIRANESEGNCYLNKLVVLPEYQRRGIGKKLLCHIETYFPNVKKFILETGTKSESNIRLYEKVGYEIVRKETFHDDVEAFVMEKPRNMKVENLIK